MNDSELEHRFVHLEHVRLHYVQHCAASASSANTVILLHGFPDFWYSWRHQLEPLARTGLRVIAPDLRGYGASDKPRGPEHYRLEVLADDVAQLVAALGCDKVSIVGHDWGGMIAWSFAMRHPERLARLSILNAPHPGHLLAMMTDPVQLRRSAYILLFQVPKIPEHVLARSRFAVLRRALRRAAQRPDVFDETELARYVEMFRSGTLSTMLDYYRALIRRNPLAFQRTLEPIDHPTQVLWGQRDPFLRPRYAEPTAKWVWDLRLERFDDAGHWVHLDARERVNHALTTFLAPTDPS